MKRSFLLIFLIAFVCIIYIGRLFQLQIIRGGKSNPLSGATIKIEYDYPERGYVYDRNGKLLVANQLSYDVMVVPKDVEPLDTLEFCSLLKIDKENFIKRFKKAERFARWLPSVFLKQLAKEDFCFSSKKNYINSKAFIFKSVLFETTPLNLRQTLLVLSQKLMNIRLEQAITTNKGN